MEECFSGFWNVTKFCHSESVLFLSKLQGINLPTTENSPLKSKIDFYAEVHCVSSFPPFFVAKMLAVLSYPLL